MYNCTSPKLANNGYVGVIPLDKATSWARSKYDKHARRYDRNEGRLIPREWRELVISHARGRVLEVGVGTGQNLPLYDPRVIDELVAIDFSPGMLAHAHNKPCRVPLTLLEMDAQRLELPDASFDTVLATLVFCTVPDPVQGLREMRRVCKPGGRIVLLEHVRIDKPVIGSLMDLLNPLFRALMGENINRRTVEYVRLAGMNIDRVTNVKGELVKLIEARP